MTKATYNPPKKVTGTVTLEIDEEQAQKLRALLGACTSCIFTGVYEALTIALPAEGRLMLTPGRQPDGATRPVISLGASYGAVFEPYRN